MRLSCLAFLILNCFISSAQIKSVLIDSTSNLPIPYVNIWVENENIGTTSNKKGVFKIENIKQDDKKILVFSSLGFEINKLLVSEIKDSIFLKPISISLDEVLITKKLNTKKLIVDKFKKSKSNSYILCSRKPWMFAKYFKYKSNYDNIPFIKSFTFLTNSKVKNAKFNIRLYEKNESGEPGNPIYEKNIFGYAKKGKHKTVVDISDLDFLIPKNGFFVVVEWLIIEENKSVETFTYEGASKKHKADRYSPKFGLFPTEDQTLTFHYSNAKWYKAWLNKEDSKYTFKKFRNKYKLLAVELELTN